MPLPQLSYVYCVYWLIYFKYLFNSKKIDNFWICSSVQIINSVPFSRLSRYSLSSIRVPSESKYKWSLSISIISMVRLKRWSMFFTATRTLSIWFHIERFTIIQSKIHKRNGFLKQRICFHRFYFKLFSLQNIY